VLQQHTADQRPECRTRRCHRRPHRHRPPALGRIGEQVADDRQRRRHDRRAGHAEQGAGRDQPLGGRRERGEERRRPESGGAQEQQFLAADAVAERAHRDQQAAEHERVDVADPQHLRGGGRQFVLKRRDRQRQHRAVHRDQQQREREHAERCPLPHDEPP
jgi:hypothetical protein